MKHHLVEMALPESNDMRAPGEASGLMALEIAMDEMAEKLGMDPVALRIANDTQVDPCKPERRFSDRHFVECLKRGAAAFGWATGRSAPGARREGEWLIGQGVAGAYRGAPVLRSGARVMLSGGRLSVEADMTDIGTGSYTIMARTAAETMGMALDDVEVRLGDSAYPQTSGSGGQFGAASATAGVYAACMALGGEIAQRLGVKDAVFRDGQVIVGERAWALPDLAGTFEAEDEIEWGGFRKSYVTATFGAHFVEVGELGLCGVAAAVANAVHDATGIRLRDYPLTLDKMLNRLPQVR